MSVTTAAVKLAQNAVAVPPPSSSMARRQLSSLQMSGAELGLLIEVIAGAGAKTKAVEARIGSGGNLMDVKGGS